MAYRGYTPDEDDTLNDILSDDEAVEEMPAAKVKEAYAKMKLFKVAKDEYLEPRFGPRSMDNDEFDRLMRHLEEMGPEGVKLALREFSGTAYGVDFVGQHMGMGTEAVVQSVFDAVTKASISEERRIEAIREKLKTTLRSCGMPRSKIARAVVQDWKATRE